MPRKRLKGSFGYPFFLSEEGMKHYPQPLIVQHEDRRFRKTLMAPLVYNDKQGARIEVNVGFVTDLASIYILRILLPVVYAMLSGYGDKAAVVHDYLYTLHGYYHNGEYQAVTRKQADQLFFRALRAEGVARWRAYLFYAGVRIGGGFSWAEDE